MDIDKSNIDLKSNLSIYSISWEQDDHIAELEEILQNSSSNTLKKHLVNYVMETIEPIGWKAIFRSSKFKKADFIVDVLHVSQDELEAIVCVQDFANAEEVKRDDMNGFKNKMIQKKFTALLIELYPLAVQENHVIDIERTAEVIDHLRFFYQNIWYPWDVFQDVCIYNRHLITERIKIYDQIVKGVIPASVSSEMNAVKERAAKVSHEIDSFEREKGVSDGGEMDELDMLHLLKLHKEMEQLEDRFKSLDNPILRELLIYKEQQERKEILDCSQSKSPANVLLVAASVDVNDFVKYMTSLPNVLQSLPQCPSSPRVQTFPSLQTALDLATAGDTIVLTKGKHVVKSIGLIAKGGTVIGLGENVEVVGSVAMGDVMLSLDLNGGKEFHLENVTLRPSMVQTAMVLHRGKATLKRCCIEGGRNGILMLQGSKCELVECELRDLEVGLQCNEDASLWIGKTKVEKCDVAIKLHTVSKIHAVDCVRVTECTVPIAAYGNDHRIEGNPRRYIDGEQHIVHK